MKCKERQSHGGLPLCVRMSSESDEQYISWAPTCAWSMEAGGVTLSVFSVSVQDYQALQRRIAFYPNDNNKNNAASPSTLQMLYLDLNRVSLAK